ncbi:MAG: aldo/keto reductase [Planctomycetes bacterium]|nr:aldo/keto reductase [Planctomycetota bacterium]
MSQFSRRSFIAAATGAAACLGSLPARGAEPSPAPPPQVPLGNTGITMSRVGQGTGMSGGNRQSNHTRMGIGKFTELVNHAFQRGITFFDLADLYGTHVYFREAMKSIPREKYTLLTKLWWRYDGPGDPRNEPWRTRAAATALERFRHELTTDYIDIVLLHCMTDARWPQQLRPYMDALDEAKAKNTVKAVGVSCHDFESLKVAAECPWVDVVLARINPDGAKMDAATDQVVPVLRRIKENGKALIGMKILGEGTLANRAERCIEFAQGLGLLDTMTIGFEKPPQIDEILRLAEKYPAA